MTLVETIRYENGTLHLLDLHQERFDRSRSELFGKCESIELASVIPFPESIDPAKVYKVRVVYGRTIETVEWHEYSMKFITSFRLVTDNEIQYHLKYTDRRRIDELCALTNGADSIIILKNDEITDSAYANILFLENDRWVTPSTPLLKGVMREHLIRSGIIIEKQITVQDLPKFSGIKLINAMIPMDRFESLPMSAIL